MSLWQFACAIEGWQELHAGPAAPDAPSDAEFDRMVELTEGMC